MNEEINEFNINDIENVVDFKGHPLVSIIVSIKNTDYLLHACLESIMYQTYPNLEIILIDNMSLSGTFIKAHSVILALYFSINSK